MLAVMRQPCAGTTADSAWRSFSAVSRAAAAPASGNSTTNWSPPIRATTSLARNTPVSPRATERNTASPASWPRRKFTSLNSSRSM